MKKNISRLLGLIAGGINKLTRARWQHMQLISKKYKFDMMSLDVIAGLYRVQ